MDLPKTNKHQRAMLLLLFSAMAVLIAIADRAPIHLEKLFLSPGLTQEVTSYFDGVIHKTLPGPYVYRVLVPYAIAAIRSAVPTISLVNIDLFLKIIVLVACQISFYLYLRLFFSPLVSLTGVFFLDVLVAFSLSAIQGPSIIETADLLNMFAFSAALTAIHRNSVGYLCMILFIATFNRETTWMILPILIIDDFIAKRSIYRSVAALTAVAVPYFGLRAFIDTGGSGWFSMEGIPRNIPFLSEEQTLKALAANIHVAFLLGPLLILGAYRFSMRPRFLRIASVITPLFIVVHYIFGTVIEARLWMPLFIILIPLALGALVATFENHLPLQKNPGRS